MQSIVLYIKLLHAQSLMPDFATPWTIACLALLSMEFSRQEHWSGIPLPTSGDLLDPGIKPESPALLVDSLLFDHFLILVYTI